MLNSSRVSASEHFATAEECRCSMCGRPDSLQHRHWECEGTKWSRDQLTEPTMRKLEALEQCTKQHGWATLPPTLPLLRELLHTACDTTGQFSVSPDRWHDQIGIDLFADGSVTHPADPHSRIACWCLAAAHWRDPDHFVIIAEGVVPGPGLNQTTMRTEVLGIVSALRFVARTHHHARIWSDNQSAIQQAKAVLQGEREIHPMMKDYDLWSDVQALAPFVRSRVQILKVTSHVDSTSLPPQKSNGSYKVTARLTWAQQK